MFDDDCCDVVNQSRLKTSPRTNLSLVLGNGLRRCLRKAGESGKHRYTEPEVSATAETDNDEGNGLLNALDFFLGTSEDASELYLGSNTTSS